MIREVKSKKSKMNNLMDISQEIESLKVEHQNLVTQYNIAHTFLKNVKHHKLINIYVLVLLFISSSVTGFILWNFGYNWFPYLLGIKEANISIISFSTIVNVGYSFYCY